MSNFRKIKWLKWRERNGKSSVLYVHFPAQHLGSSCRDQWLEAVIWGSGVWDVAGWAKAEPSWPFYLSELESVYFQGLWSFGWMTLCLGWLLPLSSQISLGYQFSPPPVSRRGFLMFWYSSIRSKLLILTSSASADAFAHEDNLN